MRYQVRFAVVSIVVLLASAFARPAAAQGVPYVRMAFASYSYSPPAPGLIGAYGTFGVPSGWVLGRDFVLYCEVYKGTSGGWEGVYPTIQWLYGTYYFSMGGLILPNEPTATAKATIYVKNDKGEWVPTSATDQKTVQGTRM
jgi:hypothetical protein